MNIPIFDVSPRLPKLTLLHLWRRLTGEAERRAWEGGQDAGWQRGIQEAAAYCERYGAYCERDTGRPDIRRAALEVCAEHLRAALPNQAMYPPRREIAADEAEYIEPTPGDPHSGGWVEKARYK